MNLWRGKHENAPAYTLFLTLAGFQCYNFIYNKEEGLEGEG